MIAIIDVSGNNLTSLANALTRLGYNSVLTHDADQIQKATHVILPGVGTAAYGMKALREHGLTELLPALKQPLLGICLGMQLLLDYSAEGDVECLGIIAGNADLLNTTSDFPVPHMGWNRLQWQKTSFLQQGISAEEYVYFVHSYALKNTQHCLAQCNYNEPFSAIINKDNFFGMQFHPEKSAVTGMTLLNNFLSREIVC